MKRIQLFEFEDQSWFPVIIREGMTNLLNVLHRITGLKEVLAIRLKQELAERTEKKIVDLGSGSGGIMPDLLSELRAEMPELNMTLSDLNPSAKIADELNKRDNLSYTKESIDAAQLDQAPDGIKTMINCFHHMPVDKASSILKSATQNKETLVIYEMAENKIPVWVWALFLPIGLLIVFLLALFMTPAVRPMRFSQLFFTYVIPLIPLGYAWDGQASLPRIYTKSDLEELTSNLNSSHYSWSYQPALKGNGKQSGYFFIGKPNN